MFGKMGRVFFLIPFLLIITSISFIGNTFRHIEKQIIEENKIVNKFSINLLLDEIECLEPLLEGEEDYKELLSRMVIMYDNKNDGAFLYCELFDDQLQSLTPRHPLTPDDPFTIFNHPSLMELIKKEESGEMPLSLTKPDSHQLHIYFRWITLDGNRYLVVSGISKYSLRTSINNNTIILYFSIIIILSIGIMIFAGYYSSNLEKEIYKIKMRGVQRTFRSFDYYKDDDQGK